jgi:hypothetical protein
VSDPTGNGIFVVRCRPLAEKETDIAGILKSFIQEKMSTLDNFSMQEPNPQPGGMFNLVFHYNQMMDNQNVRMYGEAFVQQHNGLIGTIVFFFPQEQYSAKSKSVYQIFDSFHVTGKNKPASQKH